MPEIVEIVNADAAARRDVSAYRGWDAGVTERSNVADDLDAGLS
jgi:hypothetical protein